jgi:dTDP-4-dehydrorhamnose reductase
MLAKWCEDQDVHLINIGSGCIYFGESPNHHLLQGDGTPWPDRSEGSFVIPGIKVDDGWRETDFANPKSFYSKTKYACDLAIGGMKNVTTLRIRMPISEYDVPRNLINKLRGYKQIINIPNSMTFMSDLVRCVDWAAREHKTGIYHVVNPEPLTAVQIMQEYQKYHREHTFDVLYNEQQLDALTVAKRSNCILDSTKLHAAGFRMTDSRQALEDCMATYVNGRQNVK